jgi:diguanylate cyclase (GGDEF)-like protein/PAS domain S-box-containing protein
MGEADRASATARKVTLTYAVVAAVWVLASDALFELAGTTTTSVWWDIAKGLAFVAVTSIVLYLLVLRLYRRHHELDHELNRQTEMHAALFNRSPEAMWVYDPETLQLLEVNDTMVRRYGRSRDELLQMRITDLGPTNGSERIVHRLAGSEHRGEPSLWLHFGSHGEHRWVEIVSHPVDWQGRIAMLALSRDVTAQKRVEDALRSSERRLAGVLSSMQEMAFSIDLAAGTIEYLNDVAGKVLGRDPGELFRTLDEFTGFIHEDDYDVFLGAMRDVVHDGWTDTEFRVLQPDGTPRTLHVRALGVVGPTGQIEHVDGVGVDMTHRDELVQLVEQQRTIDPLTGLPNRVAFVAAVNAVLAGGSDDLPPPVVALFDLDRFAAVNQAVGHRAGDAVLIAVAERVTSVLAPGMIAARIGGDEFAVFSPSGVMIADDLARHLQEAVDEVVSVGDYEFFVTMSIGLTEVDGAASGEDLLRDAHLAMTAAKTRTGGVERSHPALHSSITTQVRVESDLRRALAAGEVYPVYQPQISLDSDRMVGVEVLARWQHPERGLVSAEEFIAVAERTGLIVDLGQRILEQACEQAVRWRARYGDDAPRIWINLSRRELDTTGIVARIVRTLAQAGLPISALGVEVTETAFVADMGPGVQALETLTAQGVEVALDDFGTGWSSLQTLKSFPVSVVKIDRAFITNVGVSIEDTQITKAAIGMARGMSLQTLAEGVETAAQLDHLKRLGCDQAQGFLVGRPGPAESIDAILDAGGRVTARSG